MAERRRMEEPQLAQARREKNSGAPPRGKRGEAALQWHPGVQPWERPAAQRMHKPAAEVPPWGPAAAEVAEEPADAGRPPVSAAFPRIPL